MRIRPISLTIPIAAVSCLPILLLLLVRGDAHQNEWIYIGIIIYVLFAWIASSVWLIFSNRAEMSGGPMKWAHFMFISITRFAFFSMTYYILAVVTQILN